MQAAWLNISVGVAVSKPQSRTQHDLQFDLAADDVDKIKRKIRPGARSNIRDHSVTPALRFYDIGVFQVWLQQRDQVGTLSRAPSFSFSWPRRDLYNSRGKAPVDPDSLFMTMSERLHALQAGLRLGRMGKQISSERKGHWEGVYSDKKSTEVSWYQEVPIKSLELVSSAASSLDNAIVDIGGGASALVDHLLDAGYRDVTVLDLANAAFDQSQKRLGDRAGLPHWLVSDVTRFQPQRKYQVWHDRAALHFLTDAEDRARYVAVLKQALAPGGHAVIATFGPEGPLKCSGLEIRRYTVEMLAELLGPEFELQSHELENHETPTGSTQQFLYSCWTKRE